MLRIRLGLVLVLLFGLSACAKSIWATDDEVSRAVYRSEEPTSITLVTAINNRSGEGGHSSLLINGSQTVMFDPAGTWWHRDIPERNDVLFGFSPQVMQLYIDYHARTEYHVVLQKIDVSPEVAELALRRALEYGAVGDAFCSNSVSTILSDLPGFESVRRALFPAKTMRNFAKLPGVTTAKVFQDDVGQN